MQTAISNFYYLKEKKDGSGIPCRVDVFALSVTDQLDAWPEKGARSLLWLSPEKAAAKVAEPGLRHLLKSFRVQNFAARRRGTATL
mgnify:FL=1